MQIRATVKWRQSLPLTQNLSPFSSFPHRSIYCWTRGVSVSHTQQTSTPPLATLIFTPRASERHFHSISWGWWTAMRDCALHETPLYITSRFSLEDPSYHFKIQSIHSPLSLSFSLSMSLKFQFHLQWDGASYRHAVSISHSCAMKTNGFLYCFVPRLEGC